MYPLSDNELSGLRLAAEQILFETCSILRSVSQEPDEFGQEQHTYEETADVPCGIAFQKFEFEEERAQVVLLNGDAILRVRLDQPITVQDYVSVRGKGYSVEGVFDGLTVRRAVLKIAETLPEVA